MGCCCMRGKIQNFRRHRKVVAFWSFDSLRLTYITYWTCCDIFSKRLFMQHNHVLIIYLVGVGHAWLITLLYVLITLYSVCKYCVMRGHSHINIATNDQRATFISVINNTYCRMSFVWMWEMCLMYASIYVYFYASLICRYGIPTTFWR